ncbi:MAG: hypothetical protein ACRDD8_11225 [Bacteroidales bacterium]
MYLFLSFKSASVILGKMSTKTGLDDMVFKRGVAENRPVIPVEEVLIPSHCVINMMHVLCGLPPVPHYRQDVSEFHWDKSIVEAVENGFIRYDFDPNLEIVKTEKGFYYKGIGIEFMQSAKLKGNSENIHKSPVRINQTGEVEVIQGIHSWSSWKRYLGEDLYNEVISYFEECLNISYTVMRKKYDITDVLGLIHGHTGENLDILCDKIKLAKKSSMIHALHGRYSDANYNRYNTNYPHIIQRGVKSKITLSGGIIIKVSDNILNMINSSDGVATLLDGGFVKIEDLTDDIDNLEKLEYDGWVKIGTK